MTFKALDDGARYEAASTEHGIEFKIDRLRRDRHELIGELAVGCGLLGARVIDGILSAGTFNVSSPRARQERAKLLEQRARTNGKIDWHGLLEEFCQRVLNAERTGAPAVVLREVPRPSADSHHEVEGIRLPQKHSTILFGDGGTVKSYFALFVGGTLASRGVRVALADWELDAPEHRVRLERLFPRAMPDVKYVHCERPLIYEVDRLSRIARVDQLDYLIYDSAGYACAGKPIQTARFTSRFRSPLLHG